MSINRKICEHIMVYSLYGLSLFSLFIFSYVMNKREVYFKIVYKVLNRHIVVVVISNLYIFISTLQTTFGVSMRQFTMNKKIIAGQQSA